MAVNRRPGRGKERVYADEQRGIDRLMYGENPPPRKYDYSKQTVIDRDLPPVPSPTGRPEPLISRVTQTARRLWKRIAGG